MRLRHWAPGCVLGGLFVASQLSLAQTEAPLAPPPTVVDATITLTARSAAVGVGLVWGAGMLEYQGFREATGGNATWINAMLYTNFNF